VTSIACRQKGSTVCMDEGPQMGCGAAKPRWPALIGSADVTFESRYQRVGSHFVQVGKTRLRKKWEDVGSTVVCYQTLHKDALSTTMQSSRHLVKSLNSMKVVELHAVRQSSGSTFRAG
jgi:hypothetical protein